MHTYTHTHACRNIIITTLWWAQPPLSSHWCADEDGRRMFLRWKKTMFWLGSVNGTAGLPFFTQIRFQLKHRCWGKLNRTTRSRRREQPFSLFLSFHTLPNLVQKKVQSRAQQSSCTHPSIHLPLYLLMQLPHPFHHPWFIFVEHFFCVFLLIKTFWDS